MILRIIQNHEESRDDRSQRNEGSKMFHGFVTIAISGNRAIGIQSLCSYFPLYISICMYSVNMNG